jgi:hypothetical protein
VVVAKRRLLFGAVTAAALVLTAGCAHSPSLSGKAVTPGQSRPEKRIKPLILVYGDSLTVLSEDDLNRYYGSEYRFVVEAGAGSALCDWTAQAPADRVRYKPDRVVLAFTGNGYTCARESLETAGVAGWLVNYRDALRKMHEVFKGLPVTVVASPAMYPSVRDANGDIILNGAPALNAMYKEECDRLGMRYDSQADDTLTPNHVFEWSRPAFPGNGPMVPVRKPDGIHLLPAGARYYAAAIVA